MRHCELFVEMNASVSMQLLALDGVRIMKLNCLQQ